MKKTLKMRNVISFKMGVMLRGDGLCPRIYIYIYCMNGTIETNAVTVVVRFVVLFVASLTHSLP